MAQADKWIAQGRHFIAIIQGDSNLSYMAFTLGTFLLVTDGYNASYFYANYSGSYSQFFEIPELYYQLGVPLAARKQVSSIPNVYERDFQCGKVVVNFSTNSATISLMQLCTPVSVTPPPTSTPIPSPTPTPTIKPGDANNDSKVDEADYGIWFAHFTQTVTGGRTVGDFNGDGQVDGIDYTIWLNNYGK